MAESPLPELAVAKAKRFCDRKIPSPSGTNFARRSRR